MKYKGRQVIKWDQKTIFWGHSALNEDLTFFLIANEAAKTYKIFLQQTE